MFVVRVRSSEEQRLDSQSKLLKLDFGIIHYIPEKFYITWWYKKVWGNNFMERKKVKN